MASPSTANTARTSPDPLVEPAAELSPEEVERYSRHLIIPEIGAVGQRRLKHARVLVIGAGGLGSPALLYLAAAGVGTIGIIDDDAVDLSNLQRQIIHGVADVGRPKIESARDAIAALNPLVDVRLHHVRLDASNALELFSGYDLMNALQRTSDVQPAAFEALDEHYKAALAMITAPETQKAFKIEEESDKLRDAYGRNRRIELKLTER